MIYAPEGFESLEQVSRWCFDLYEELKRPSVTYAGDKSVWSSIPVSTSTAHLPASNYPSWEQLNDDGSGSVGVFSFHFEDGEYIFFDEIVPGDYEEHTHLHLHTHFMTTTDVDPADNFKLGLEYQWVNLDDAQPTDTSAIELDISTGVDSSYKHQHADLGIIERVHAHINSILCCRLYRAAADSDNYAGKIAIPNFHFFYHKNTHGSRDEHVK
jgi:hypothetical protein